MDFRIMFRIVAKYSLHLLSMGTCQEQKARDLGHIVVYRLFTNLGKKVL